MTLPRIARTLLAMALLLLSLVGVTLVAAPAQAKDLNCDDFSSQAAAQQNLNDNPGDPNNLDADNDGLACETSLPCPCAGKSAPPVTPKSTLTPNPKAKPQPRVLRVVKVIDGELVRVRLGNDRPYVIHQIGVQVPDTGCERRSARRELRSTLKPGTPVVAVNPDKVRDADGDGNQYRFIGATVKKKVVSLGLAQIAAGYADADRSLNYPFKGKYKRVNKTAIDAGSGYHGSCA